MERHPVEVAMGLTAIEILDVVARSDRCYQTVRGFVAEYHLEKVLDGLVASGRIKSFVRLNKDGQPDFRVEMPGRSVTIECKNVMSKDHFANGDRKVDFQRTRNQVGEKARTGCFYKPGEFDILAAADHTDAGVWTFKFVRTEDLPSKIEQGVSVITKSVRVPRDLRGNRWTTDLVEMLHSFLRSQ